MNSSQSDFKKRVKIERKSNTFFSIKKISVYDFVFEQHFVDHDIYFEKYNDINNLQKSHNLKKINAKLILFQTFLSFSRFNREKFLDFKKKNLKSLIENKMMINVFLIIADMINISSQQNLWFTHFKNLIDNFIIDVQLDFYDGTRSKKINKWIQKKFKFYIVSSTKIVTSCLFNFFLESKNFKESTKINKLQASYNEIINKQTMNEFLSYNDSKKTQYNIVHTIISTYYNDIENFTIYFIHANLSSDFRHSVEYHMMQLDDWKMTDNPNVFRKKTIVLKNARNWTKKKQNEFITATNDKTSQINHSNLKSFTQNFMSISSNQFIRSESKMSTDEFVLNNNIFFSFIMKTSVQTWTKPLFKISINRQFKRNCWMNKFENIIIWKSFNVAINSIELWHFSWLQL